MAINNCKLAILIVSMLSATFDIICDWLMYYEISGLQQGLVFGPFSENVVNSLFVFCCIGSFIYILDLVFGIIDLKWDELFPLWLLSALNVLNIWVEDVPQILLNVYIAGCREEAVTILQMVKAVATLVEVVTNISVAIAKTCYTKFKSNKSNENGKWLAIPIGIGLTVMFIGSILVFTLTHFYLDSGNKIKFYNPTSFYAGNYDSHKYLNKSGIHMNFDPGQTNIVNMDSTQWIKLIDVTDVTSGETGTVVVSVKYDSSPNTRLWIQSTTSAVVTSADKSICYDTSTTPFPVVTTCATDLPATAATTSVVFRFVYMTPSGATPLGDIIYNYRVYEGNCVTTSSVPMFSLAYYNVESDVDGAFPLVAVSSTTGKYYSPWDTLEDISESWKTGHFGCRPTGRTAPKLDTGIIVPCASWT